MSERAMSFNTDGVKSILSGAKTQTRQRVEPQPPSIADAMRYIPVENRWWCAVIEETELGTSYVNPGSDYQNNWESPFGIVGDQLWVREKHAYIESTSGLLCSKRVARRRPDDPQKWVEDVVCVYATDYKLLGWSGSWRPAIQMPRWASRITLDVASVQVEKTQGEFQWVCDFNAAKVKEHGHERESH